MYTVVDPGNFHYSMLTVCACSRIDMRYLYRAINRICSRFTGVFETCTAYKKSKRLTFQKTLTSYSA